MPSPREKNIWGNIRVQLNEVQNLILNGRYQNAVILNREILKTVVRLQVDRACLVADNLSADIQQLFSARAIDAASRDHYNEIRNYAEQAEAGVNPGAQGANQAFSLMKDELEKYMNSANRQTAAPVSRAADSEREERPRVPLGGKAGRSGAGTERAREMSRLSGSGKSSGKAAGSGSRTRTGATTGRSTANRGGRSGRSSGGARRNARNEQPMEIDIYSVLKIAIPVACVLLVIILIRVLTMGGGTIETTAVPTTPAAVETTTAPETTEEETTEEETTEAVPEKMVTTSGVRVRTKPSTEDSEVLDVLDPDTEVTYKGAYDNEWAIIDYNGQEAYVSSQYLKAAS